MSQHRLNLFVHILLITALLLMQFSTAHIHRQVQHDHGDGHHQHHALGHSHQNTLHHQDTIDAAHETFLSAIEIPREFASSPKIRLKPSLDVLVAFVFAVPNPTAKQITLTAQRQAPTPRRGDYTTPATRAPPLLT